MLATPPIDMTICVRAPDKIVECFESLGHLCELGIVQSFCGAEPLGLFRFSSLPHKKLIELLTTRFAHLDDTEALTLFTRQDEDEWWGRIERYGIEYHTGRSSRAITEQILLSSERQRIAFLKRKLLEQLEQPDKFFLRRDYACSAADVADLHAALIAYAPHQLLWVDHTDNTAMIGAVQFMRTGLLRAHYGHFWPDASPSPAGLGIWLKILNEALYRFQRERWKDLRKGALADFTAISDNSLIKLGWFGTPCSNTEPVADIPAVCPLAPILRHKLLKSMSVNDGPVFGCEPPPLEPASIYVISAWIWLPSTFCGWIGLAFPGLAWIHMWAIDLGQRDCWQRIVTSTRLNGTSRHRPGLVVEAECGMTFISTDWRLERGVIPADCFAP